MLLISGDILPGDDAGGFIKLLSGKDLCFQALLKAVFRRISGDFIGLNIPPENISLNCGRGGLPNYFESLLKQRDVRGGADEWEDFPIEQPGMAAEKMERIIGKVCLEKRPRQIEGPIALACIQRFTGEDVYGNQRISILNSPFRRRKV